MRLSETGAEEDKLTDWLVDFCPGTQALWSFCVSSSDISQNQKVFTFHFDFSDYFVLFFLDLSVVAL